MRAHPGSYNILKVEYERECRAVNAGCSSVAHLFDVGAREVAFIKHQNALSLELGCSAHHFFD